MFKAGPRGAFKALGRSRQPLCNAYPLSSLTKAEILKESLPKTLYDLVRTEQFVPFSIVFATGQRFEIKTRDHISLGPVNRSEGSALTA